MASLTLIVVPGLSLRLDGAWLAAKRETGSCSSRDTSPALIASNSM